MSETGYALGKMPEPQNGEEVKERLRHSREVLRKAFGDLFGRTTFDFALEYIQQLESAQPKWVSVEERLPEENFEVLMLFKHNMAVGWYGGEGDWYSNTDDGFYASCDGEPTYWMPLPEPPKEEA